MRGIIGVVALLMACGGGSKHGAKPAPRDDKMATCIAVREMLRACQDDYLPMLVGVRIELDNPPGVAAQGATEEGRAALLAQARSEYPAYSSDEANQRQCKDAIATAPAEMLALVPVAESCLREPDCAHKVACWRPIEVRVRAGQKH